MACLRAPSAAAAHQCAVRRAPHRRDLRAWHLPPFLFPAMSLADFLYFFAQVVAASVVMTWLYNRAGGRLGIVILAHLMRNLAVVTYPPLSADGVRPVAGAALVVEVAAGFVVLCGGRSLTRLYGLHGLVPAPATRYYGLVRCCTPSRRLAPEAALAPRVGQGLQRAGVETGGTMVACWSRHEPQERAQSCINASHQPASTKLVNRLIMPPRFPIPSWWRTLQLHCVPARALQTR